MRPERNSKAMSAPAIHRSFAAQYAFSRQVWARFAGDATLGAVPEKLEADRDGDPVTSPPPTGSYLICRTLIAETSDRLRLKGSSLLNGTGLMLEGIKIPNFVDPRQITCSVCTGSGPVADHP